MKTKETTHRPQEEPKEVRSTFIINERLLEKVKCIAYWDRITIKEVMSIALQETVVNYEKKNGPIKPIPKK